MDKPIIFAAPMILALLAGRKTQTRRVLRPQPIKPEFWAGTWVDAHHEQFAHFDSGERPIVRISPGDRLWVRETFSECPLKTYYRATERDPYEVKWIPSIHMPCWASRLTLEVTGVEVERVQDISEADAIAEGCHAGAAPQSEFADLWNSIHGPSAWEANPWVYALTFMIVQNKR
jgi:hypothetical protein